MKDQIYLTPPQAAALIRVGRGETVIEWIHRHQLPAELLPSGRFRILKTEFLAWAKARGLRTRKEIPS